MRGRKLVICKWVYKTKYASDGSVERHKAQLVAKGFSQVEGIDYNETFNLVAKMNSIFLVLDLVASYKWEVHEMDVKSTFLHGDLQEEIYMEQPPGYVQNDSSLVCRLMKSLYGLKQAPQSRYAKMDNFLLDTNFSRCHYDPNVYTKKVGIHLIILVLYVDVFILTGGDPKLLSHVKTNLKKKFVIFTISLSSKYCKPRKEYLFPSLSMLVTFFATFTWKTVNRPLLPSSWSQTCFHLYFSRS
jgi:hypothetical protein